MDLGPDPTEDEVAAWLATLPPEVAWQYRAPPVLMPVPAAEISPLAGKRVVVCQPERGVWLYEQRAATKPHEHKGQMVVGVLDEADWYRAQREPEYIAVPRPHPLDQLWVEEPQDVGNVSPHPPDQSDLPTPYRARSIVADVSRPPVRWLRYGPDETGLTGSRCWVLTPRGAAREGRVCGEPRRYVFETTVNFSRGLDGLDEPVVGTVVPVCPEDHWYRWRQTGETPGLTIAATQFVWLE